MSTQQWNRVEIAERMTAEEFLEWAPETQKAELIEGVMIVHSPASDIHEALFKFLLALLRGFVEEHDLGIVRGSRTAVEIAPDEVFEPDILFVARTRRNIVQAKGIMGAPDFVIEILSASTAATDRGVKLRGYERAGVPELWLIDPYGPAGTEFYRLENQRYVPVPPEADGRLRSASIPSFWVDVNWLWTRTGFIPVREALEQLTSRRA